MYLSVFLLYLGDFGDPNESPGDSQSVFRRLPDNPGEYIDGIPIFP